MPWFFPFIFPEHLLKQTQEKKQASCWAITSSGTISTTSSTAPAPFNSCWQISKNHEHVTSHPVSAKQYVYVYHVLMNKHIIYIYVYIYILLYVTIVEITSWRSSFVWYFFYVFYAYEHRYAGAVMQSGTFILYIYIGKVVVLKINKVWINKLQSIHIDSY